MQRRGSWIVVLVLLLGMALGILAWHWHRERNAWLRTPPGRLHACIEVQGSGLSEDELFIVQVRLSMAAATPFLQEGQGWVRWKAVAVEPTTSFRPAFLQLAQIPDGEAAGQDARELLATLRKRLPALEGEVTGYRLALVDAQGEILHQDP